MIIDAHTTQSQWVGGQNSAQGLFDGDADAFTIPSFMRPAGMMDEDDMEAWFYALEPDTRADLEALNAWKPDDQTPDAGGRDVSDDAKGDGEPETVETAVPVTEDASQRVQRARYDVVGGNRFPFSLKSS